MAGSGELPHTPYYGSVDSTPLWLILLGATFDWTGDRAMLERLWPNALAALRLDRWYGDRDGDGFVEYERRSERGLLNQGWKDSSDAIRDHAGDEAEPPIALAEVQGYVYDAKRRLARLAAIRGDIEFAIRLDDRGRPARRPFEPRSGWMDRRYYAMALDSDKRQADAIASNAGHCLWSGIVTPDRAREVVDRLLRPDDVLRLGDPDVRRGTSRATTPSVTTPARSGRTTRRSSRPGFGGTGSTTPRTGWSAR